MQLLNSFLLQTADGVTRGSYSYLDANGVYQTVNYISDALGFKESFKEDKIISLTQLFRWLLPIFQSIMSRVQLLQYKRPYRPSRLLRLSLKLLMRTKERRL